MKDNKGDQSLLDLKGTEKLISIVGWVNNGIEYVFSYFAEQKVDFLF